MLALFPESAAAATERLPDLKALRPRDITTQTTSSGQRRLRFSSVVANVGVGPFEVVGTRASTSDLEMNTVVQNVYDDTGSISRTSPTSATMYFAGDGHTHWHLRDLETYELIRTDNGVLVGTGEKHGFCFFDNVKHNLKLPGAPSSSVYTDCGDADDLTVTPGLSVGWADRYYYNLPDQYIDITGLKAGRYRLYYRVDVQNWFTEIKDTNNQSCVTLQIDANSVNVIDYKCSG